jgi:hypothetical protein
MRFIAAMSVGLCCFAVDTALAGDCSPHCDYYHNYGPYDFSYVEPGLTGYPVCDRQGNCSPYLIYLHSGHRRGQVTIRPVTRPKAARSRP